MDRLIVVVILSLAFFDLARGADWRPPVLHASGPPGITGLVFDPTLKLELVDKREKKYSVRLHGHYKGSPNGSLIWATRSIKPDSDENFELLVPVNGMVTPLNLTAIDAYGVIQKSNYEIQFDDWAAFQAEVGSDLLSEGTFAIGLGPTFISYHETDVPDYSSIVLTVKGGYTRPVFSPRWSLGLSGFATLLPISENYAASARFLGFNIRLGYHFLKVPPPWKFSIQVGSYYTTMLVSQNAFGFENVNGPQLYPTVERALKNGDALRGYVKLSPLATNSSILSFNSREVALGVGYGLAAKSGKAYSGQFDYSDLLLHLPNQTITAKTLSLSVTYGF